MNNKDKQINNLNRFPLSYSMFLSTTDSPSPGGTTEPPLTQQLPSGRDVTSPNPDKFSGEIRHCGGFLLQCKLVFNRSPQSFPHDFLHIRIINRKSSSMGLIQVYRQ
ncbi:hypothetical protein ILYODFUR_025797 [Ilyodon furcidens]|uniref:Uncharacterized protein n=1 Tax=Ilyodon furcidens TaxID=33524 RepID=A0ABV0V905_9TELE